MGLNTNEIVLTYTCLYTHCVEMGKKVKLTFDQVVRGKPLVCPTCFERLTYVTAESNKEKCPRCKSHRIDPVGRGGKYCCDCKNVWGAD